MKQKDELYSVLDQYAKYVTTVYHPQTELN